MSDLYLSRARLKPDQARLGPILFPEDPAHRMSVSHRLVWTLFPAELQARPFLYRESAPAHAAGRAAQSEFIILSSIPPRDRGGILALETRDFAPVLRPNEKLRFSLRANPTAQQSEIIAGRRKTRRYDVVMQALHALPAGAERAKARPAAIRTAGLAWLEHQAQQAGFRLPDPAALAIDGYEQFDVDTETGRAKRGRRRAVHSRLDYEGMLEVCDPALFLSRVAAGFGRARAFGHGLMLIRRA